MKELFAGLHIHARHDWSQRHPVARANRDYLRGLYGVIKDNDAHVRFTFLTGISKFSKANLFSQLRHHAGVLVDLRVYDDHELGNREQVREW